MRRIEDEETLNPAFGHESHFKRREVVQTQFGLMATWQQVRQNNASEPSANKDPKRTMQQKQHKRIGKRQAPNEPTPPTCPRRALLADRAG